MVNYAMGFSLFKSQSTNDKRRLEAFMDALPFEYCGWSTNGIAIWSRKFPQLFGLASIQNVRDIQSAILPSDAAALEGMIYRLQQENEPFTLSVKIAESGKTITLHGMKGRDLDGIEGYDVLWAEDTTQQQNKRDDLNDTLVKLRKDVEQHRTLLNLLPQSIWVTDFDQNLSWCNDTYRKITGETLEEALGEPPRFKALPLDKDKISLDEMTRKCAQSGENASTQARVIIDGKRRLADIHLLPHTQAGFVVGVIHDITEQEELRAELKRYVAANAELMEQLSTAIAIYGADHRLEFYNQAYVSLWGLEEQWLNTHPTLNDVLEKLREMRRLPEQADFRAYKKSWLDMFTTLLEQKQEMMYLPDGLAIKYMVVPHPMGGLMITFEDVTSRLELESSYNTLIAVQRETLDNLAEGVAVYGSDGRLKLSNPSYLKLWNLHPEDVEGEPHINKIIEKKKAFFKGKKYKWDDVKDRLVAHAIDRTDTRETLKRSDDVVIECMSVSLPDGGVMVTYRDITDSMRVRKALEEKNAALEDAEKLKTDFLAKVSYQLRTPLNAIAGFSEILDQEYFGDINEKQREYTRGIMEATERLSTLINDILDLSSIEAGYLRLDRNPVDILDLLDNIYELSRDWAGMETLHIKFDRPEKSPGIFIIDERRVKQALLNIIRNAINYTPGGGSITLSLAECADNIIIKIQDTGIGIAEEDREHLFEPFGSSNHGEDGSIQHGTGLGLSLANNIISLHNGTISVNSKSGEGTSVEISLPKK